MTMTAGKVGNSPHHAIAQHVLEFYAKSAAMTSPGRHARLFDALPHEVGDLAELVSRLLLHEHFAPDYGVMLPDERRAESHIRAVERMLGCVLAHDGRPLSAVRPVGRRLVGVCRHFTVLLVALLRAKAIPARARCGFGAYFDRGRFEDHWVCECWNSVSGRWVLVDAQIDEVQRSKLRIDFDLLDVPRDEFVIAGDAWVQCRAGHADPAKYGIFDLRGLWFVAGNVLRDFAALNNMEMLPWDVWGAMPRREDALQDDVLALLDRVATLTRAPDASFAELVALYQGDERIRVPSTVFNALLNRPEAI
jgi:Transglutaminase-like superfamily